MSKEIAEAMAVIKQAMIDDGPSELGSYAHGWHCDIAMACYDAIITEWESSADMIPIDCHQVANDAASRFMKLCFGVETTNEPEPALIDWKEDDWFAEYHHQNLNTDFKLWWVSYYGSPKDYKEAEVLSDMHEYWARCAFALMGWNGRPYNFNRFRRQINSTPVDKQKSVPHNQDSIRNPTRRGNNHGHKE
jgi:hypothetical protein